MKDEKVAIDHIKTSDNQIEHEIEEKLSTIELEMRQRHSSLSPSSAALKTQLDLCKALVLNIELAREIEQNYLLLEQTERTITKKASPELIMLRANVNLRPNLEVNPARGDQVNGQKCLLQNVSRGLLS